MRSTLPIALLAGLAAAPPAHAATLTVGPDQPFQQPSQAAAAAQNGDTVSIAPGTYFDCAIWRADGLTIQGEGAVLTDKACEDKASFITRGVGITIRGITFTRIRVADRNGAGIRVEGGSLTVEHSHFLDNQLGILDARGSLVVRDCAFEGNGVPGATADILADASALLRVERSTFAAARGPSITSAAATTELTRNQFEAAAAEQPAAVVVHGGLAMDGNTITLASLPAQGAVLVLPAADGAGAVALRHNILLNHTGHPALLLLDWGAAPLLDGNVVQADDTEASTNGATLHRLKQTAHNALAWLRRIGGHVRRVLD